MVMRNESQQIVAVATDMWGNVISPLFDSTPALLVLEIEDGRVIDRRLELLGFESAYFRGLRLTRWGIEVLICGAVSFELQRMLESQSISLIPFISGEGQHALDAYLSGSLSAVGFRLPVHGMDRPHQFQEHAA